MEDKWSVSRLSQGRWHKFVINRRGCRELLETYVHAVRSAMIRLPGEFMIHPQDWDHIIVVAVNDETAFKAMAKLLPEDSYRGVVKLRGEQRASLRKKVAVSPSS